MPRDSLEPRERAADGFENPFGDVQPGKAEGEEPHDGEDLNGDSWADEGPAVTALGSLVEIGRVHNPEL